MSQQKIDTLHDAFEQEMKIEEMQGYPQHYKLVSPSFEPTIMGIHNQISTLINKLKYLTPSQPMRPQVWWMHQHVEGHHVTE